MTYSADSDMNYRGLWLTVIARTTLIFGVEACSDATLVLSTIPGVPNHNVYQIAIGTQGNTRTEIRKVSSY